MVDITTRQVSGGPGVTVKGGPLTNEEMDANFISLQEATQRPAADADRAIFEILGMSAIYNLTTA
jgi:hypothetical protein